MGGGRKRFKRMAMGRNTISAIIKQVTSEAGVEEHITPHSFRVTGINRMLDSGVDESRAMQKSRHSSHEGFRAYVRASPSEAKRIDGAIRRRRQLDPQTLTPRRLTLESANVQAGALTFGGQWREESIQYQGELHSLSRCWRSLLQPKGG